MGGMKIDMIWLGGCLASWMACSALLWLAGVRTLVQLRAVSGVPYYFPIYKGETEEERHLLRTIKRETRCHGTPGAGYSPYDGSPGSRVGER